MKTTIVDKHGNAVPPENIKWLYAVLNYLSGKQDTYREVESQLLRRVDEPTEIIDVSRSPRKFSIVEQFQHDVQEIANRLEPDGTYYYPPSKEKFLRSPDVIATAMVDSGIVCASPTKVREARKLLGRSG